MSSQFKNAFVRQMGREFAHSTYKEMGSYESELNSVDETTFTAKLVSINYVWIFIASVASLFCPFAMVVPFIMGIVRLVSPMVRGHYRGLMDNYKYDARYRGGKKYLGKNEQWVKAKKSREDCTEGQIRDSKMAGVIEISISIAVFVLTMLIWVSVLSMA